MALFGRAVDTLGSVAETKIGLTLHGVVIAANEESSSAIISGGLEQAQIYFVGDAITSGASLDAVFGDHVVLSINGQVETLSFPKAHSRRVTPAGTSGDVTEPLPNAAVPDDADLPAGEQESLASEGLSALRALLASARGEEASTSDDAEALKLNAAAANSVEGAAPADVDPVGREDAAASVTSAVGFDPSDPTEFFDGLRKSFRQDPVAVLKRYGLTATSNGYRVGIRIADTTAQIGLAPDDLIVSANGKRLGNMAIDQEILDEVFAAGHLRLEVERAGEPVRLSFPLR